MEIPSKKVYEILAEKGVEEIHHANTVITACQFLREGALISRGTIDRKGWYQTPQTSDSDDKKYSVWFDIFADSVDIHQRAGKANVYGPVLFVLDAKIISKPYTGKVWVTKLNPTKWAGLSHEERWFTSADDLRDNFVRGRFDQMIVFRHCGGELPFQKHLKEVIVDDPQYKTPGRIDLYSMAFGALTLAKTEGQVDVRIRRRKCGDRCSCLENYKADRGEMAVMFFPRI